MLKGFKSLTVGLEEQVSGKTAVRGFGVEGKGEGREGEEERFFKGKRTFKRRKLYSTSYSDDTSFFLLSFPEFPDQIHQNQCKGIWWKLKILV